MNRTTYNHINQLLDESGLLKSNITKNSQADTFDFTEETILITGAAGSIGSGITKQLLTCKFKTLILVDNAESPLYYLIKDLEIEDTENIEILSTDIRDESAMNWLFETFKPTLVFHAAAYKHVPLMEDNPYEAIRLNILATQILGDLSLLHKTKKFIFISTDKAVNPINVMGMTKYVAESYLKTLNSKSNTSFAIARFGNIFGSNGSVVPLFMKQIDSGVPITVTNRRTSRYFISKNKACNLILKMATFKKSDPCIFTFNMGKAIKILDLAEIIADKYPGNYQKESLIKITNLRPGEKIHEELTTKNEILKPTIDPDIFSVFPKRKLDSKSIRFDIFKKISPIQKPSEIKSILKHSL
jgi:FlaA1/EpsC-like NDP-sugar epimerase